MGIFTIPNYNIEDLQKKLNKIRNKGVNVTFNILRNDIPFEAPELGEGASILCSEIEIEGTYIINGWRFVGTIQHASPVNIIRLADTSLEGQIPERYRTAEKECEHCHIRRDRNDTFLVYNEENNEWKQVGRTCLRSYTNGLDAEVCAQFADVMSEINRITSEVETHNYDADGIRTSETVVYDNDIIKKKAYKYVQENGYVSGQTPKSFNDHLNNINYADITDEQIQAVQTWLENAQRNDWQQNALAAWSKDYYEYRDSGLITSAVSVYLKNKAREEAEAARLRALDNPANTHVGDVGDKISFTVASSEVIYRRRVPTWNGGSYPVYKLHGTDGRIYIWGCSDPDVEIHDGDIISGTVKKLSEFRGERQTEVTRCKITGHTDNTTVSTRPFRFR